VTNLRSDSGTALIWFIGLLVLVTLVCLLLVTTVHEYLFVRGLHDFVEQYALAEKTLVDRGFSISNASDLLREQALSQGNNYELSVAKTQFVDAKSLQVIICATWHAPLPIFEYTKLICESAIAR